VLAKLTRGVKNRTKRNKGRAEIFSLIGGTPEKGKPTPVTQVEMQKVVNSSNNPGDVV
jgi:hypothetical protein